MVSMTGALPPPSSSPPGSGVGAPVVPIGDIDDDEIVPSMPGSRLLRAWEWAWPWWRGGGVGPTGGLAALRGRRTLTVLLCLEDCCCCG
jgi:hypothetical protein